MPLTNFKIHESKMLQELKLYSFVFFNNKIKQFISTYLVNMQIL